MCIFILENYALQSISHQIYIYIYTHIFENHINHYSLILFPIQFHD